MSENETQYPQSPPPARPVVPIPPPNPRLENTIIKGNVGDPDPLKK